MLRAAGLTDLRHRVQTSDLADHSSFPLLSFSAPQVYLSTPFQRYPGLPWELEMVGTVVMVEQEGRGFQFSPLAGS